MSSRISHPAFSGRCFSFSSASCKRFHSALTLRMEVLLYIDFVEILSNALQGSCVPQYGIFSIPRLHGDQQGSWAVSSSDSQSPAWLPDPGQLLLSPKRFFYFIIIYCGTLQTHFRQAVLGPQGSSPSPSILSFPWTAVASLYFFLLHFSPYVPVGISAS